jgi:isochorismate hydrolase
MNIVEQFSKNKLTVTMVLALICVMVLLAINGFYDNVKNRMYYGNYMMLNNYAIQLHRQPYKPLAKRSTVVENNPVVVEQPKPVVADSTKVDSTKVAVEDSTNKLTEDSTLTNKEDSAGVKL